MKSKEEIEQLAMDSLKGKWSHLYQFGYPTRPFPTNYENDWNCVMLGYSLKIIENLADKKYTEEDLMNAFNAGINNDYGNGPSFDQWLNSLNKQD